MLYKEDIMTVRVEIQSEIVTSDEPAKILNYEGGYPCPAIEVIAEIELKQGADGGWYRCVVLKKQEQVSLIEA